MEDFTEKMRRAAERNAFTVYNHIDVLSVTTEKSVVKLDINPQSKNPYGMVHGGALYSMADNAAGFLVSTDRRKHVTQSGNLHFLGNQSEGTIFATARIRHRGKKTALVTVDITGDNDKLLATGEFTFFCVDSAPLNIPEKE